MNIGKRDLIRTATIVGLLLLLAGANRCDSDNNDSDVVRAAASCRTSPSGNSIRIDQGDPFEIVLTGSVPCTGGGGEVVICGPATFTATVNQSLFFNAGTLDEWSSGVLAVQRGLSLSTSSWLGSDDVHIEITSDQTGSDILARCDFRLIVSLALPELSSTNLARGASTCSSSLDIQWPQLADSSYLAGYSYTLLSQDDPNYDALRFPDNSIELGSDVTTFTTPSLESGHVWEFNLLPIDTLGGSTRFYSSFWAKIENCAVSVTWPREGDTVARGVWTQLYWVVPIQWGGDDVTGAYQVSKVELLGSDGSLVLLGSNLPNIGNNGFSTPLSTPLGSGYRIRMTFERTTDVVPELPQELIGLSGAFTVSP
jgi:hypothetical protein